MTIDTQRLRELAQNYQLKAIAPDHYYGVERDAFSNAYKRCGEALAELRELLAAAPQAEGVQPDTVNADDLAKLLPYGYYMDPPDGGSPTVLEQIARMAKDAARYRWLRTHGLQRAWVSLGTDFEGGNFASFRCEFNLPEPPNLPYEDDEGLQWADKDFDAAIDAAIEREILGGGE